MRAATIARALAPWGESVVRVEEKADVASLSRALSRGALAPALERSHTQVSILVLLGTVDC